ncbi:MAG: hypothetical protein GYB33_01745 [Gammaproteobacteria bacterium]|nr:hypothetical protein [Gammaproteobacteria bacterium]
MNSASTDSPFGTYPLKLSAVFVLLLLLTWWFYQVALSGPFMFDDPDNLSAMRGGVTDWVSLQHYLSHGNAGPLGRPLSKLSFLLNDNNWPSTADTFKYTNLLLHMLCGVLMFAGLRLALRARLSVAGADWTALFISALFLLHPLQVSTVMYVVQRMTQLASLFILAGVAVHCYVRMKYPQLGVKHLFWLGLSAALCTLLAVLSKESGALLPVYLLIIEATLLAERDAGRLFTWWRRIVLGLPTLGLLAYLCYLPRWVNSYTHRDFSLTERLLTEPVVLWDYVGRILSMKVSGLGLFHDDYPVYSSLAEPRVWLALVAILAVAALALIYRRRSPLLCFGVLWFLGGHLIESTTPALELYFEHRNYLPMIGPLLVVLELLRLGFNRISADLPKFIPLFAVLVTALAGLSTWGYASEWRSLRTIIPIWAVEHPDSPRAQRGYAYTLASIGMPRVALQTLEEAAARFPADLSFPVMSLDVSCAYDLPPRYDLTALAAGIEQYEITDGLRPALTSVFRRLDGNRCMELAEGLHLLVASLERIGKAEALPRSIAGFHVLDGNLYIRERKPFLALRSFAKIDQIKPTPDSALRLADLYLLMADFESAIRFVELARERDEARRFGISAQKRGLYADKIEFIQAKRAEFAAGYN